MPRLLTQSRFQKTMKKIIKPQSGWLDVFFAVTGKLDGTVKTASLRSTRMSTWRWGGAWMSRTYGR